MPVDQDTAYPDPDLVTGYLARRGVQTFHTAKPGTSGETGCGLTLADLIAAGWARQLRRRGLHHCLKCAKVVDLDAPLETEGDE